MRKCWEKQNSKLKCKSLAHHASEPWRESYERMMLSSPLQQLQDDSTIRYCYCTHTFDKWDGNSDMNLALTDDDLKDAWRSILACGKSIERQLNSEGETEKKPFLSTLLAFIGNSYGLPAPESCFGTHHVMVEEVSHSMMSILAHVEKAQQALAKVRDSLFDGSGEGIDSDTLVKVLDAECRTLPIRLKEVDNVFRCREIVVEWERRVVALLDSKEDEIESLLESNSLRVAERLQAESRSHGYLSKTSVQLDHRILKAYELRDRILRWKKGCAEGNKGPLRILTSLVKEVSRVRLIFPEATDVIKVHQAAEGWIDRANIAIRSKMSLDELRELILRVETMPLDLLEYIDKLKARLRAGEEWLESLEGTVPSGYPNCNMLQLMEKFRISLQNGNYARLHELALDGTRIPVDVEAVKLLQVALDAKNWTSKAQKWIPNNLDCKKGKLADLREHMEKAASLRDKLPLAVAEKAAWKLECEKELSEIVDAADAWSEEVRCSRLMGCVLRQVR
jgi:PLU-1-like protein